MIRALATAGAALTLAAAAAGAPPQPGAVFAVVGAPAYAALPSAEVPNAPGSLALPPAFTSHASTSVALTFAELQELWRRAGESYAIPWEVLAAINKIETNFGQNMGPSSAGAVGWMQFMPDTWLRWGLDANGDGVADPWHPEDAVHAAARYLAAAGGRSDLARGIFAYNHAQWYVDDVLELAQVYARGGPDVNFSPVGTTAIVSDAQIEALEQALAVAVAREQALGAAEAHALERVARIELLSVRLGAQKQAVQIGVRREQAAAEVARLQAQIDAAHSRLEAARAGSWASGLAPGGGPLLAAAAPTEGFVFPVGGGAAQVTVGHTHHDYPAADIAAPLGSPVYAHAGEFVLAAWPEGNGRCGIGGTFQTEDGQQWTYCHLAYLDPAVRAGAYLSAGTPLGVVGMTGRTTGPHLHLQLQPAIAYPQEQSWFASFAGTAFRWQGEPAPPIQALATGQPHSVFAVVSSDSAAGGQPVAFTR